MNKIFIILNLIILSIILNILTEKVTYALSWYLYDATKDAVTFIGIPTDLKGWVGALGSLYIPLSAPAVATAIAVLVVKAETRLLRVSSIPTYLLVIIASAIIALPLYYNFFT